MRFFDYAKVASWEDRLAKLDAMAEPERWTNISVPAQVALPVLDSFIRYTFLRLHDQRKIVETDRLACFNTGLLTPNQEEIYGLFTVSESFDSTKPVTALNQKWWLMNWVRSSDRQLSSLRSFPELVTYWTDPAELIFNPSLQIQLNIDHIIRDNLNRFPIEFGGFLDVNGIPTDLTASPDIDDDGDDLSGPSNANTQVPLATRNVLDGAMKHSIRLAQRTYRMAVPQYYHGKIQLLLPLYLRTAHKADLALTLERNGDWYRASTVLYPDWAYRHARLLSRPNSEWLGGFRTDQDSEEEVRG